MKSVLIANRGEIAVRVARACRDLGLRSAAVYSTDDEASPVLRHVDQAVRIGPAAARRSYAHIPAIIEAARLCGADAIHPGYGFLSEDPDFAAVCEAEGLIFVGPPAGVLARLGDKSSARAIMAEAGLPLLPGTRSPVETEAVAAEVAAEIGFPLIIKAVAGGGGRGMRIVTEAGELARAFAETRANALALFGDGRVYLERYLPRARHVEVQVLADRYGRAVSLGARDCSVQRRRQKLVEESPPPSLSPTVVDEMCRAAVEATAAVGYVGAGTFEFLVDDDDRYYFMEINCRIQVEHPVTELVSGVDLVVEQLRVAAGEPLALTLESQAVRGVSIECRVNAEDPDRGFVPTPGTLTAFTPPAGPFVRVDTHVEPGYRIPASYDSLLAKVVVWAPTRRTAIARMRRALDEFVVEGVGVRTTVGFLRRVLDDPRFQEGVHRTALVDEMTVDDGPGKRR